MMTNYTIHYDNGIETDTLDNIKCSYHFILDAMHELNPNIVLASQQFLLGIGEISANIDNYTEFIEAAFGQDVRLMQISIRFTLNKAAYASVCFDPRSTYENNNVTITCSDKGILAAIVSTFDTYKKKHTEKASIEATTIYQGDHIEIKDNAIVSGGNVGGSHNQIVTATNEPPTSKSNKSSVFKSIFTSIAANWMWWIMGLVVVALLSWWGIK